MAISRGKKILLIIVIILFVFGVVVPLTFSLVKGTGKGKIGVIEVEGTITDLSDAMEDVIRFKEDDSIRGVILRINSPGGAVGPTQEMYAELKKLKSKNKIVYVSMGSVCASGGYYLAAMGDRIYANPSTITGSIGVIMQQAVVEDLMKKIGVQENTIKSGLLKDTGSPFRKMTDEERKYLQDIINSIYEQFIKDVSEGRRLPVEKVRELADGRIYTGLQAREVKLIDSIGTFYDVVDDMKKTLGIKGKPTLIHGKRPFSILKWLISSAMQDILSRTFSQPVSFLYKP
ncbi:MAG TPA: signal peptide peptidase SppA [Syntrophorhabdaceae bacterium]|nr:signal peptide peptidase SppA [Syntrophorhabdaceae bacterium]